jgi:hypothetical protein
MAPMSVRPCQRSGARRGRWVDRPADDRHETPVEGQSTHGEPRLTQNGGGALHFSSSEALTELVRGTADT